MLICVMAVLREATAHADDVFNLLANGDFELVRNSLGPCFDHLLENRNRNKRSL
jgi:hypothetical protein